MNYCEGCFSLDGARPIGCILVEFNKKGNCPCWQCMIKMMCNSACEEFDKFEGKYQMKLDQAMYRRDLDEQ